MSTRPGVSRTPVRSVVATAPPAEPESTGPACSVSRSPRIFSRASLPPWGFQNWSMITAAARPASDAMMSVSSTEMKLEETNWLMAKVRPTTRASGHICFTPRFPSTRKTRNSGTTAAKNGA